MKRRVPRKQADLIAFANAIKSGLQSNPDTFKDAPIKPKQLFDIISATIKSEIEVADKKSYYQQAMAAKKKKMETLYKTTAEITNYLYRVCKNNKPLLSKMGINIPNERKTPKKPGQCLDLIILQQEIGGKVVLKWKQPQSGGIVKSYVIQRQELGSSTNTKDIKNTWENIWTEVNKQAKIKNQPEGKTFDYRVRALNRIGIGAESNNVTVKF